MIALKKCFGIVLALLVVGAPLLVQAQTPADPVVKFESKSDIELDLSVMVDDLLPLLKKAMAEQGADDQEELNMLIDLFGVAALDNLKMVSDAKKDYGYSKMTLTLDSKKDGGLLADMMAISAGECGFADYLSQDDLTLLMSVQNFAGHLELMMDLIERPEFAELTADMPKNEDGDLEINGFNPRKALLPLLSGELDIFMLDMEEGGLFNPMQLPAYLVLGTEDGPALLDLILEIAALFAGDEAAGLAEMIRSLEPETIGDFEVTVTPFGGAFAVSQDYFILGVTADPLREMLAGAHGDLKVPDGRTWMYINGEKYGRAMEGIMEMAGQMGGDSDDAMEEKWMSLMYSNLFDHLESEVIRTTSKPGRLVVEAEVHGSIMTGMYNMLHGFMLELPEIMEQQRMAEAQKEVSSGYRSIISILDPALTQYGIDHGGHFPADPTELVAAGYLEDFPLEMAVPAGTYVEGGYTYHTLLDDSGEIIGYYLFVYGGGEGTGYDVYTPHNLSADGNFVIGSDGSPDGVASFCYDGLALKHVEDWN